MQVIPLDRFPFPRRRCWLSGRAALPLTLARIAAVLALGASPSVEATAVVPSSPIEDEEVLVVWNAAAKTEHLVYRAWFHPRDDRHESLLMIATPTRPTVKVVENHVLPLVRASLTASALNSSVNTLLALAVIVSSYFL